MVRGFSVARAVPILLLAFSVSAETRVYPNEYIVTPNEHYQNSDGVSALGFEEAEDVGTSGLRLLKPSAISISSSPSGDRSVPYTAENDQCAAILATGRYSACEPNYQLKALITPNDPRLSTLWGMGTQGINAQEAWDVTTGTTDVVVAIIDTGIDYTHPDLAANMWRNTAEVSGNGVDDDHNGYVDDIYGINATNHSGNPLDDNDHGTHVAGTIGGVGNNGVGVVGVNWRVKMMGLKFLDSSGSGSLSDAIECIDYMVMMKNRGVNIRVSNNSWGGGGFSSSLKSAIQRANAAGIIFAAAAGNEANDNDASPSYPSSYDIANVVSVAAVDRNHNLASFSNYGGASVDIAAPGVDIVSTTKGNTYSTFSGTSMATPHVAGALALLFSAEPSLTMAQAITRLYESGVDAQQLTGVVRTGRMANVSRMVHNVTTPVPPAPVISTCQYTMQNLNYNPRTDADNAAISIIADEGSFTTVSLPFSFPFHGTLVNSVYLSPNGVIYTRSSPSAMDYQNGSRAPNYSIAALQSDLVAEHAPQGVRYAVFSDHLTVFWRMKLYSKKTGGDILVRLSLYSDGRIEDFIDVSDAQVLSALREGSTIGLTGGTAESAFTYAYNSSIASRTSVRFTPACGSAATASVSSVVLRGVKSNGSLSSRAIPGRKLKISVGGRGNGAVPFSVSVNRKRCNGSASLVLSSGLANAKARVPSINADISTIAFTSGNVKKEIKLLKTNSPRSRRARSKKLSSRSFSHYCASLLNSIRQ